MKKVLLIALISLVVFLLSSCMTAKQKISKCVDNLKTKSPIELNNKDIIDKVEYDNETVTFYVLLNDYNLLTEGVSYAKFKSIETNQEAKKMIISKCLSDGIVIGAFKDVTKAMAEETDLSFKVICHGDKSDDTLTFSMTWREVLTISKYLFKK